MKAIDWPGLLEQKYAGRYANLGKTIDSILLHVFPKGRPSTDSDERTYQRLRLPASAAQLWKDCSEELCHLKDALHTQLLMWAKRKAPQFTFD